MADGKKTLKSALEKAAEGGNTGRSAEGEALLKLVNVLYDTDENKLPQLTRIERRAVLPLSIMMMKNDILDKKRIDGKIPLSKCWLKHYFQLQRSVDRWYFMVGAGLAHEQAAAEVEKAEEEFDLQ